MSKKNVYSISVFEIEIVLNNLIGQFFNFKHVNLKYGVFSCQYLNNLNRDPDKVHIFISIMPISSANSMFDHLLESSHRDDSNKWSNIEFGEEIT